MRSSLEFSCAIGAVIIAAGAAFAVPTVPQDHCVAQDDAGTVSLPAACRLASPTDEPLLLPLPAGELLALHARIDSFFDVFTEVAPDTGDETVSYQATMTLHVRGTAAGAVYERTLALPAQIVELHRARSPGDVQTFDTEMVSLQAELFGDPDFDILRVTAGNGFGMPSPGQTTFTRLPRGDFHVDSFFDIEYRIDFQGAPGGPWSGQAGTTTPRRVTIKPTRLELAAAAPNPLGSADVPADARLAPAAGEALVVTAGLPPGDSLSLRPRASGVTLVSSGNGSLGGPSYQSSSDVELIVRGGGGLAGLQRTLVLPHVFDVHVAPFDPAADVQSFDTEMVSLSAQLPPGDPDFDELRLTAGSFGGLPSPGHTTLTRLPSGNFQVDSFFDIDYRIEYTGTPSGALAGASGVENGTLRLLQGGELPRLVLHTLGPGSEPFGGVRLVEADDPTGSGARRLVVSNIGSSGLDGVRLSVGNIGSSGKDGVRVGVDLHLDIGPAGAIPAGAECRLQLITDDPATGGECSQCMGVRLVGEPDGRLAVHVDPAASQASSSTLARLRLAGGSVDYRSLAPDPTSPPVARGALGTAPDGRPLRVLLSPIEPDGRAHIRVRNADPVPMSFHGSGGPDILSEEVALSLDGLPPGEPVKGVQLSCSNLPEVTLHEAAIFGTGFDPDPDNNCAVVSSHARVGTVPDGSGTPRLELREIGAAGGGVLSIGDLDRDGVPDRVRSAGMEFDVGPAHGLPADAVARVAAVVEPCLGTPEECGLGLQLYRTASSEGRGTVAVPPSLTPRSLTLTSLHAGVVVDSVDLPVPLPPELFGGELRALDGSPLLFDVAVRFDDLFCSCDTACECVEMRLRAPQPSPLQLAGSALGPALADELELRLALEPDAAGVPIELVALSLTGTHLCDADLYLTRFDPPTGDVDGDGVLGGPGGDCDDRDSSFWSPPGEVQGLRHGFGDDPDDLCWVSVADTGGSLDVVLYDTLRSTVASDFSASTCVETRETDTHTIDPTDPPPSEALYYLVRASNACPQPGTLGSGGGAGGSIWVREAPICP